jgi:hypothetical protein
MGAIVFGLDSEPQPERAGHDRGRGSTQRLRTMEGWTGVTLGPSTYLRAATGHTGCCRTRMTTAFESWHLDGLDVFSSCVDMA